MQKSQGSIAPKEDVGRNRGVLDLYIHQYISAKPPFKAAAIYT